MNRMFFEAYYLRLFSETNQFKRKISFTIMETPLTNHKIYKNIHAELFTSSFMEVAEN